MKCCPMCDEIKSMAHFHKGGTTYCKKCCRVYAQKWHQKNYVAHPRIYEVPDHIKPTRCANKDDILWAAGFFEGDGSFGGSGTTASAAQKNRWPLDKLKEVFGGTVNSYELKDANTKGESVWYYRWSLCGPLARSFGVNIYPFVSPRRQEQIRSKIL